MRPQADVTKAAPELSDKKWQHCQPGAGVKVYRTLQQVIYIDCQLWQTVLDSPVHVLARGIDFGQLTLRDS